MEIQLTARVATDGVVEELKELMDMIEKASSLADELAEKIKELKLDVKR